jgi:hypothetical protein
MELIPSNKGKHKLCHEHYLYTKKSSSNSSIFWVCTNRTLGCRGSLRSDIQMTTCQRTNEHDHPPNKIKVEVAKVRANMKEQAKQGHDKPGVVYTSSLVDVDEETLASLQSADICKRTIRNQRAQEFPKVPDNCREIIIQGEWEQNCQGDPFLFFDSGQDSESRILCFATHQMLKKLAESNQWLMDGNFAMAPAHFHQLFVTQVPVGNVTVPAVFALLPDKRQTTYEVLFQAIVDTCTELATSQTL